MEFNPQLAFKPAEQQKLWQADALKKLLSYLKDHAPFYQRLFSQSAVNLHEINSLEDLQKLPTTGKTDIQQYNHEFLCAPKRDIREYMCTSGTLGAPVTIALTEHDLKRLAYNECQSFLCAGGRPEDIYQLMLTLDRQFMAGAAYYQGIRQMGAAVLRTGPGLPAMQWEAISRTDVTAIVAVPSFIVKFIEWAKEHKKDLNETKVRKAICIGENLRTPDFKLNTLGKKISENWNVNLFSTYASTEMQTAFTECPEGKGGHQQPDLIILEILDENGMSLNAGAYGEITVTTLGIEGMPLLRYRTGDMACFYDEPCTCGRNSKRLGPIIGRKQQMIKYKGTSLYPPAVFEILNQIPDVKEYILEAFTSDLGTDELKIHIFSEGPEEACAEKIKSFLKARLRVTPALHFAGREFIQKMQFPPESRKPVRFLDRRKPRL